MRRIRSWSFLNGLLLVLAGCGESTPDAKTAAPGASGSAVIDSGVPQWTADPALLGKLAAETTDPLVKKYRLCPPKGCEIIVADRETGRLGEVYFSCDWHHAGRKLAVLSLGVVEGTGPLNDQPDLAVTKMANAFRRNVQNFILGNVEQGLINGVRFARVRWNGDGAKGKLHGIVYLAMDGKRMLSLHAQDVEPQHEDTLRVAEAAILTWKKAE